MITISDNLRRAVWSVYQQIGCDLPSDMEDDPEALAEVCCDADRLAFFGHPEADAEWQRLNREHGYEEVLRAVAEKMKNF